MDRLPSTFTCQDTRRIVPEPAFPSRNGGFSFAIFVKKCYIYKIICKICSPILLYRVRRMYRAIKGKEVTRLEDSEIVSLFFERSEQAIEELDCKYGTAVKKTVANILRDRLDVEECVSDTYLRVWNSIPPHAPNPLAGFVCRIARNLAVNRYHANNAEKRGGNYDLVLDEMEQCIPSGVSIETEYEAKELSAAINRFLSTLDRKNRFLFVRRYWYADSIADLAAMTRSSANQISVRLFRLREKLRITLVKEGFLA